MFIADSLKLTPKHRQKTRKYLQFVHKCNLIITISVTLSLEVNHLSARRGHDASNLQNRTHSLPPATILRQQEPNYNEEKQNAKFAEVESETVLLLLHGGKGKDKPNALRGGLRVTNRASYSSNDHLFIYILKICTPSATSIINGGGSDREKMDRK